MWECIGSHVMWEGWSCDVDWSSKSCTVCVISDINPLVPTLWMKTSSCSGMYLKTRWMECLVFWVRIWPHPNLDKHGEQVFFCSQRLSLLLRRCLSVQVVGVLGPVVGTDRSKPYSSTRMGFCLEWKADDPIMWTTESSSGGVCLESVSEWLSHVPESWFRSCLDLSSEWVHYVSLFSKYRSYLGFVSKYRFFNLTCNSLQGGILSQRG